MPWSTCCFPGRDLLSSDSRACLGLAEWLEYMQVFLEDRFAWPPVEKVPVKPEICLNPWEHGTSTSKGLGTMQLVVTDQRTGIAWSLAAVAAASSAHAVYSKSAEDESSAFAPCALASVD